MKFDLPRMDSSTEYRFKDLVGRAQKDFSEKLVSQGFVGPYDLLYRSGPLMSAK